MLEWKTLDSKNKLSTIIELSNERVQIIFKHSTTCPISSMAKNRIESQWDINEVDVYYLDLLSYREVSNAIAHEFGVRHESPQVLVIKDEEVIFHDSHLNFHVEDIQKAVASH